MENLTKKAKELYAQKPSMVKFAVVVLLMIVLGFFFSDKL
jgi:hypothetical protein